MNTFLDFKKNKGLIPAIIQDAETKDILMLGYMDEDALGKTIRTGYVHFWSRSKKRIWMKGEESGNKLKLINLHSDCDDDTLLLSVKLRGKCACHTGRYSCFYKKVLSKDADDDIR